MTNNSKTNKRMNTWIRAAAGHAPAAQEQAQGDAPKPMPTANAGNGARGPGPDIRTGNQRMNDFIRGFRGLRR